MPSDAGLPTNSLGEGISVVQCCVVERIPSISQLHLPIRIYSLVLMETSNILELHNSIEEGGGRKATSSHNS